MLIGSKTYGHYFYFLFFQGFSSIAFLESMHLKQSIFTGLSYGKKQQKAIPTGLMPKTLNPDFFLVFRG